MKNKNTLEDISTFSREIYTYQSILNLLHWDQETFLPEGGIVARSEQISQLTGLIHDLKTGQKFKHLLEQYVHLGTGRVKIKSLTKLEISNLWHWHKDYIRSTKLPTAFVKEFSQTTSEASQIWSIAKKENNFKLFAPFLKKIVRLNQEKAAILGFTDHPYDALLELYEPCMNVKKLDKIFSNLAIQLKKILKEIQNSKKKNIAKLLQFKTSPESQKHLGEELLNILPMEKSYSRLDYSSHPFSIAMHPHDSRITTRILPNSFMSNIFSILHEAGHSMYEMGLPLNLLGTPVCQATSLTIHESQSRFWETFIGRSKSFTKVLLPLIKNEYPKKMQNINLEQFYRACNSVQSSLTRVEADEVTYGLHVILRYEIEKKLIQGEMEVEDLPIVWKNSMRELLGVEPDSDTLGCLQDIHWSLGDFGYFPTYALGNLCASQFFESFTKEHKDWDQRVQNGDLEFIRSWLKDNIHSHGKLYDTDELLKKITGKTLSEEAYCKYLKKKYSELYF